MILSVTETLTYDAYRTLHSAGLEVFLPVLETVRERHSLPALAWSRLPVGRNVVFALGDAFVVKLTPPFWWQVEERAALGFIAGQFPLETPRLVATGDLEFDGHTWQYLVQTRVAGTPLHALWRDLPEPEQVRLALEHGTLMRDLHSLEWRTPFPEALHLDWAGVLMEQFNDLETELRNSVAKPYQIHQITGAVPVSETWRVPEALVSSVTSFLEPRLQVVQRNPEHIFLHGDLNPLNLMVDDKLEITGIVDFSDAKLGPREHDLISPIMNFYYRKPAVLEAFLSGYGGVARDEIFTRCLLWYGHDWAHRLGILYGEDPPQDWNAVARRLQLA
jgi:hygromycin-B 7''-O-kinase